MWFVSMLGLICIRPVDKLTKESISELSVTSVLLVLFYIKNVIFSGGFWHHCLAFLSILK